MTVLNLAGLYRSRLELVLIIPFEYRTEREPDVEVVGFAYGWHNRVRPHTLKDGLPPEVARVV